MRPHVLSAAHAFVWYASALHLFWAVAVMCDPTAITITTIVGLHGLPPWAIASLFTTGALTALLGITGSWGPWTRLGLLLGQQSVMMISLATVCEAVWRGQYGDTAVYPRWFIAADQCHWVATTLGHAYAVVTLPVLPSPPHRKGD
jgi:hypothetical protein